MPFGPCAQGVRSFQLLISRGFIETADRQPVGAYLIKGLSWEGHDLLDSVRNQEVWGRTKAAVRKVGEVGLDLIVQIAKAEAKRLAAEKLGLTL